MENKRLIPAKELAPYLSVSPKTLYQWAELRQIPSYKINGSLRFNLAEVMEFIETCKVMARHVRTIDDKTSNRKPIK